MKKIVLKGTDRVQKVQDFLTGVVTPVWELGRVTIKVVDDNGKINKDATCRVVWSVAPELLDMIGNELPGSRIRGLDNQLYQIQ